MRETGTFSSPIEISFAPLKTRKKSEKKLGFPGGSTLCFLPKSVREKRGGNCWSFAPFFNLPRIKPRKEKSRKMGRKKVRKNKEKEEKENRRRKEKKGRKEKKNYINRRRNLMIK